MMLQVSIIEGHGVVDFCGVLVSIVLALKVGASGPWPLGVVQAGTTGTEAR